ncbi:hypothetical protein HW130_18475 [Streptomyces sp. PKU-EA00015]|uniref:hypothetical protein n=1 Tax=Streptomyces sp. PKU-EA00015 TaxID=2748326 RepID=UPI0015A2BD3E|nr:hypothetical protein [Streptomyces sp. PKU-EA00015]NWF28229.1 hypothetical protein [Streptomyces sp. PKU-EA00015]
MKPVVRSAVQSAATLVEKHREVVVLALSTDREELRLSARRFREKGIHNIANERDDEAGLAGYVGTALTNLVATPAFWVEHHWQAILAAVVRREATDRALVSSVLKWLPTYEGPTDAPVFKVQSWQYRAATKRAEALAEVKAGLTAVRNALREVGELAPYEPAT